MKSRTLILALALAGPVSATAADVEAGKRLVMQGGGGATACVACHGADGAGNAAAGFPRLAGLDAGYLQQQIQSYKNGSRNNPIMGPIAQALSDQQAADAAAYYAAQQLSAPPAQASDAVSALGREIAINGDWGNKIPACVSCHGPNGSGVGPRFPRLAGQHAGYIVSQIKAWKDGSRHNDPLELMKAVAQRLSAEQAQAAAEYFAQQRLDQ